MANGENSSVSALRGLLDQHFTTCAAIAAATVGMVGVSGSEAHGAIVYSGVKNAVSSGDVLVDLKTFSVGSFSNVSNALLVHHGSTIAQAVYLQTAAGGPAIVGRNGSGGPLSAYWERRAKVNQLAAGTTIGGDSAFQSSQFFGLNLMASYYGYPGTADWSTATTTGFFGFVLPTGEFGWGRLKLTGDTTMTLVDWAYESNPGVSILAGAGAAVPEPAGMALGLLAVGAAGLRPSRKLFGRSAA